MDPHEGLSLELDDTTRMRAIEWALQYRGDVTFTLLDGTTLTGYAFDCTNGLLRLDKEDEERVSVESNSIVSISFTGRDMAAGKSFDRWIERYIEKRLAGETAEIPSEPLD